MAWSNYNEKLRFFTSKSINKADVVKDLIEIIDNLDLEYKQLLFFIDATNGNVCISGFNSETNETIDDKEILVELNEVWQDNDNAHDFDYFIISSIKTVMQTEKGKALIKKQDIFYQTEDEGHKQIR